jgi:hypothetical protein
VIAEAASGSVPDAADESDGGVDIERLADLVYRLLQAEVRLGLARGECAPRDPRKRRKAI